MRLRFEVKRFQKLKCMKKEHYLYNLEKENWTDFQLHADVQKLAKEKLTEEKSKVVKKVKRIKSKIEFTL